MAHRPAGWPLLPVLGGLIVLAGCSGTPFGDQLSRSFSGGGAAPTPSPVAAPPPAKTPAKPAANPPAKTPVPAKPAAPAAAPSPAPATAPASPPAPYRVTLKLPLADPSAPAEAVTRALRAAGVPFEVETIERVSAAPGSGAPVAPTITPAPAAR